MARLGQRGHLAQPLQAGLGVGDQEGEHRAGLGAEAVRGGLAATMTTAPFRPMITAAGRPSSGEVGGGAAGPHHAGAGQDGGRGQPGGEIRVAVQVAHAGRLEGYRDVRPGHLAGGGERTTDELVLVAGRGDRQGLFEGEPDRSRIIATSGGCALHLLHGGCLFMEIAGAKVNVKHRLRCLPSYLTRAKAYSWLLIGVMIVSGVGRPGARVDIPVSMSQSRCHAGDGTGQSVRPVTFGLFGNHPAVQALPLTAHCCTANPADGVRSNWTLSTTVCPGGTGCAPVMVNCCPLISLAGWGAPSTQLPTKAVTLGGYDSRTCQGCGVGVVFVIATWAWKPVSHTHVDGTE